MIGLVQGTVRTLLGVADEAEHELLQIAPLGVTEEVEAKVTETVSALHRSAEAIDRHVEALEQFASTLPELSQSVERLSDQLALLIALATPVERVEEELSGFARFFHRRGRPKHPPVLPAP